jgi:hypothetical protein
MPHKKFILIKGPNGHNTINTQKSNEGKFRPNFPASDGSFLSFQSF